MATFDPMQGISESEFLLDRMRFLTLLHDLVEVILAILSVTTIVLQRASELTTHEVIIRTFRINFFH